MAADSVLYRNAVIAIDGAILPAQFKELNLPYAAEMLDRTTFGDTTKNRRGGLFVVSADGKGFVSLGTGSIEEQLFGDVGNGDVAIAIWPDGITEGSQTARGYAFVGQLEKFNIGAPVGQLLGFDFAAQGAGLG